MTARRQPSTTSLSKYIRAGSPANIGRSIDFCNSFWGVGDGGVDVLFARMRGAMRTMDELRNFWKERAAIEEDYAKRLGKLAKQVLGRDEIGELRNSLDTVRLETDKQSSYHLTLSQQIKNDLENQATTFCNKQNYHKKVYQSAIEKEYKAKQTQESYVKKAREKYEQDCMRINSYTAQSTLVQGRDLEKINLKLERAQATVQTNERDFANFARAFQDTAAKWEQDWKSFCDTCQDLEDDRMEFMKDNMWAYANAVSTVCVSDDESCEKIRVALEGMDSEKEMENFVRDYGTGPQIPAPPAFFTYNSPEASSASVNRTKPANFVRSSQRSSPLRMPQSIPPEEEDEPPVNTAGRGAGGGHSAKNSVSDVRPASRGANGINGQNGYSSSPSRAGSSSSPAAGTSSQPLSRKSTHRSSYRNPPPHDPMAEPIDPNAETFIKVGGNAYKVDLSNDPQRQGSMGYSAPRSASPSKLNSASSAADDPLARQLEELQNQVQSGGSVRRNSVWRGQSNTHGSSSNTPSRQGTADGLAAPRASSSAARDYRNSAEMVVGSHPSLSRPASPNPNPSAPTAAFMVPKKPVSPGAEIIDGVLTDYHQSLPGERKSISRSGSRSRPGSYIGPGTNGLNEQQQHQQQQQLQQGRNLNRPPSVGHAGVGAHGRSSPQPMSRSASPTPSPGQLMSPPSGSSVVRTGSTGSQRTPSPNPLGIALDANNARVTVDEMAQRYQQQQAPMQAQTQYRQPPPSQQQQQQPQYTGRSQGFSAPVAQPSYAPPPAPYQAAPPSSMHVQQQPSYSQPAPQQPSYNTAVSAVPPPPALYQAPPPSHQQQQPTYQQSQAQQAAGYGQMERALTGPGYYGNGQLVQQQQQQQQQQQRNMHTQQQSMIHAPQQSSGYQQTMSMYGNPMGRTPSPQPPVGAMVAAPTRQVTEDGAGILFYVQALYDYQATIDEEFDFQAGDVIAVTATPEDGWWSGVLLDENRRQPGRHIFPSNFVRLF
ncbi:SH3 domain-containing protein [Lentinula raphanica]|uniref:SH3 domain-containing protein n=1 Tax=Lentinula raphanica TaxID=153919 RepID=A0AA38UKJ7_9AGAR|nr:SH3 domain-containing protein [Lentinula raphanica]